MNSKTLLIKRFRENFNLSTDGRKVNKVLHENLIVEEMNELLQAVREDDFPNIIKEYVDIMFVVEGYLLDLGIAHNINPMFAATYDNNMAKLGKDGKARFREDGKLIKPDGFVKLVPGTITNFSTRELGRIKRKLT